MENCCANLTEKDSLQDLLNLEKSMAKVYATAITEGCSNGFRTLVKEHLNEVCDDQFYVYTLMTERGYYQVESAEKQTLAEQKQKFSKVKKELCC